jgi:dimethylargininase
MGTESRKEEPSAIEASLGELLPLSRIEPPARIEGGDILRIGKKIFVGLSTRTNLEGLEGLKAIAEPMGFELQGVEVSGSLHLKTAVCALDDQTVLLNSDWVDKGSFDGLNQIKVDQREPFAANVLRLGNRLIAHSGFERTIGRVRSEGYEVIEADISEFLKAEAGLTCLCLIIEGGLTPRKPQDT